MLRSVEASSLTVKNKLAGNTLQTTREVLVHFYYVRQLLMHTDSTFLRKIPGFNDVQGVVQVEVVGRGGQ